MADHHAMTCDLACKNEQGKEIAAMTGYMASVRNRNFCRTLHHRYLDMSPSQLNSSLPSDGPPASEIMDAMRSYADGHRVQEMLHILLARLLETQPLDPFEFLIQTLQKDDQLDALEKKATLGRFDLRREKTKKQLVLRLYKRLVALQRTQHDDKLEAQGVHLVRRFLLLQVRLDETRCHMQKLFPSHYRDLISWFIAHKEELPTAIPVEQFTRTCMQILGTQALT